MWLCVNSLRCEADWQSDCHGFVLPVQHHSNVDMGHELFSTVILIPSYKKLLAKLHSMPFCRHNNQTFGSCEHLEMISLPLPPINWAII